MAGYEIYNPQGVSLYPLTYTPRQVVGVDTSMASSAIVQINGTTGGIVLPRLTQTQRDAIVGPTAGLAIYNSTIGKIDVYNGSTWDVSDLLYWVEGVGGIQTTTWLTPSGATADQNAALIPKGSGAIIAAIPDGTATGGNARGQYAVDLQRSRSASNQVASGNYSVIGGGCANSAIGSFSSILGGKSNCVIGVCSVIGGGELNTVSNSYYSGIFSGVGSKINNDATYNVIGGGYYHCFESGALGGVFSGQQNCNVYANYSFIGGGQANLISGCTSSIAKGQAIVTGLGNCICAIPPLTIGHSFIGSGKSNTVSGGYGMILGGVNNFNNSVTGVIVTGLQNTNTNTCDGFIGTGRQNTNSGQASSILNGCLNENSNNFSTIVGGCRNTITGISTFIGGGSGHCASGSASVIVGGCSNLASGACSIIGGGCSNKATGAYSGVMAGQNNCAIVGHTFVGGGLGNKVVSALGSIVG
jgi:hypothetical protein